MEVLASGDMPRGGGPLSDAEMTTIAKWIDAGAKFDGPSETAALAAGTPTAGAPGMLQAVRASGNESVQFIRDLAPVVVSQCIQCHAGMQPAGRLNLTTFSGLLRGGDSGPAIMPGKPKDSLLIKKLRGTAGDRMPLRKIRFRKTSSSSSSVGSPMAPSSTGPIPPTRSTGPCAP